MLESLFFVLVVMLMLLSTLDLFVGVSNDAANFLNSAVGTRIAPLAVIILIASAGVLIGATSSSGMMEIARKGMFFPEMFTYRELMIVFASVMISDVLLLNVFNSLGLPTSTTVSIIFELLGAAFCASVFKIYMDHGSFAAILDYIKLDRTAAIVSGILLSVIIAFFSGMVVQFIARLFFSFRFEHSVKFLGGLFTGASLTAIGYFLLIKGVHGVSFMKPEWLDWVDSHIPELVWGCFAFFFVVGQVMALAGLNIFKLIVLSGTFALAFSFAGNDLVNFVGVPLAALDSYEIWSASGEDASGFFMTALNLPSKTDTLWLFLAGAVMSITLFVSKKARHVVQTTVNLSSSTSGEHEQFGASTMGRIITRMGLMVSRAVYRSIPKVVLERIAIRYRRAPVKKGTIPMPFDYVRASVNLVLASALISVATSLKLPLSTTYVTFMVAMGSSFADGAWDRESAVYRISGVITVVAGWFITGMSAFTFAFVICSINNLSHGVTVFVLIPLVFAIIIYTNFIRKDRHAEASSILKSRNDEGILQAVCRAVPQYYDQELETISRTLNAFFEDNELKLRRCRNKASNIQEDISDNRGAYYSLAQSSYGRAFIRGKDENSATVDAKFFFYLVFSNLREAAKSVHYATDQAVNHVANRHTIFGGDMKASLMELLKRLDKISSDVHAIGHDPSAVNVESMAKHSKKLNRDIDKCQMALVSIIGRERVSMHSSEMYLTFLQQIRDFVGRYTAVGMQERALAELVAGNCVMTPVEEPHFDNNALSRMDDDEDEDAPKGKDVPKARRADKAVQDAFEQPQPKLTPVELPKPPSYKG